MLFSKLISQSTRRLSVNVPLRSLSSAQGTTGRGGPNFYVTEIKRRMPQLTSWGLWLGFFLFWPFAFKVYNNRRYAVESA